MTPPPEVLLAYQYTKFSRIIEKIKVKKAAFADMFTVERINGRGAGQAGVFKLTGIAV